MEWNSPLRLHDSTASAVVGERDQKQGLMGRGGRTAGGPCVGWAGLVQVRVRSPSPTLLSDLSSLCIVTEGAGCVAAPNPGATIKKKEVLFLLLLRGKRGGSRTLRYCGQQLTGGRFHLPTFNVQRSSLVPSWPHTRLRIPGGRDLSGQFPLVLFHCRYPFDPSVPSTLCILTDRLT